ncbi:MAG: class D sortase [Ruminococcus sp.]|nr:class D sortase [Ruminococcus sp.]
MEKKDKNNKKSKQIILHIITPFMLAAVTAGITAAASIVPSDKLKVYTNIAFMDSLRADPTNDDTGLVIKDNDIDTSYEGETSETGEVIRPAFGEQYAVISCDKLGVDIPVYWGTEQELLEHGACQSSSSAIAGTKGNSVISAHVDTFFSELESLDVGDTVTIITNYGKFIYTVRQKIEFSASNRKYIVPSDDSRLTLYTCKRDLLGASDMRTGVICDLTESGFYTEKGIE